MTKLFSFGLNILADIFYPKYCFGCRRASSYLCKFCITQIPQLSKTVCIVCNLPSPNGWTHSNCLTDTSAERLLSALSYHNPLVSDMIITGKYYFIPEVFAILGAITAHYLLSNNSKEDFENFVVCAIPLHTQRQRWRGFNQSEIAGKIIAQALGIPYVNLLTRPKATKTQKNLTAQDRKINMANAFAVPKQFINKLPKRIILIDDVTTTGQTFKEAVQVLKQNKVKTVWCISLAKD